MEAIIGLVVLALFVVIHFTPSYLAIKRNKHNRIMIICVNVFLGWSLIGWCAALYLALKSDPQDRMYNVAKL